jgi:hypothetical protein
MLKIKGRFGLDRLTQTAGTVITQVVPPNTKGGRAVITNVAYVCAATAHTLTFMKALGQTVATAAAASGQAVVNVEAKTFLDQTVAANDFAVVQHSDGTYGVYLVSSVSSLAITFASNLTAAVADNAKIWWFGAAAEAHGFRPQRLRRSHCRCVAVGLWSHHDQLDGLFWPFGYR